MKGTFTNSTRRKAAAGNILRKDFSIINNRKIAYLDSAATTQKPKAVIDSLKEFYEWHNANSHRGIYKISEESTAMLHESRNIVGSFINASPEEIIFTKNSTDAINSLATSLEKTLVIGKEHNMVATIIEHHSNFVPWQQLAKRTGSSFRIVDYDIKKNDVKDIAKLVDKNTVVVAFSAMSNVTGLLLDVKSIVKSIRKKSKDALIVVDATQFAAHRHIDAKDMDVDFLVFSAHKIYGPTGVGALFGKIHLLGKIHPFNYGGNMINTVDMYDSDWAEIPDKFEAGTLDTAGIVAFAEAIKYFEKNNDLIIDNEEKVYSYALKELKKIKGLKIIGHNLKGKYGPVISFIVDKIHPHDLATICDEYDVCIRAGHHCAQPFMKKLGVMATSRISIGAYNTTNDIDRLIAAIKHAMKILR